MTSFLVKITRLGVADNDTEFERIRTKLVNVFSLVAGALTIAFGTLNISTGFYTQAFIIYSGCLIITAPTLYLNYKGKVKIARSFFAICGFLFIDAVIFRAVFNFENRYNEIFMVGYSTVIVVLLDNPIKFILFVLTGASTIAMITLRQLHAGLEITNDIYMAYLNTAVAFFCVYYFTSVFRTALSNSLKKLQLYSEELEFQEKEIKKQRDEIFVSRKLLRSTIDSLPVFIGLIDMTGKYLIANSLYEKTFHIPINEIEGKHYTKVLPESILKSHEPMIFQGLKGESPKFDEETELPDGRVANYLGRYLPIYDAHGKQFALAVYVVDVTKLKDTEEKLRSLNSTKDRLLSIIGHDIKGPLSSLHGLLSISPTLTEKQFKKFIDEIRSNLDKVTFNVDNVLNWAKTQMDGFNFTPSATNISELIENSIDSFSEHIKEKKLVLTVSQMTDGLACVDKESISLVLRNILSNAIKFSPEKGTIEIISTEDLNHIIIDVIDSGPGIDQEKINELKAGAKSLKSEFGTMGETGTGLGLSLSADLVKINGGSLQLMKNSTLGTTARILIPKEKVKAV